MISKGNFVLLTFYGHFCSILASFFYCFAALSNYDGQYLYDYIWPRTYFMYNGKSLTLKKIQLCGKTFVYLFQRVVLIISSPEPNFENIDCINVIKSILCSSFLHRWDLRSKESDLKMYLDKDIFLSKKMNILNLMSINHF